MATAFMGYVLPFGQMSFWGATVITNLLSPFPSLIEWVSGGHYVYNPTLKRFFIFHFILPFLLCGFRILHLFYLHFLSSNNPLRNSTNIWTAKKKLTTEFLKVKNFINGEILSVDLQSYPGTVVSRIIFCITNEISFTIISLSLLSKEIPGL